MARKQNEPGSQTEDVIDVSKDQEAREKDLRAEVEALKAKVKAGEDAALDRVCKHFGIDPKTLSDNTPVTVSKPKEKMVRCFVNYPVNINGTVYKGHVQVPYLVFQVISEALGKRRMRILNEAIGNNYQLQAIEGGGMAPKLIGQVDEVGDPVGKVVGG